MNDPAKLLLCPNAGKLECYRCSRCDQLFIRPEDVPAEEGRAEVGAAFERHVAEMHSQKGARAAAA